MKHLYIIGNGFDLFTGLKTKYADFRWWLENNYPFIYEAMQVAYNMDGEWWNDFEVMLGQLDIKAYVGKFTPPEKSMEEILEEIEKKKVSSDKYNLSPNFSHNTPCARRLRGLLDVLQYCFEKWVENCQKVIVNAQYIHLERDDSYFINFNYTDVLQQLYKIPDGRIWHIHGRASKYEHLIFGHNNPLPKRYSGDEDQTRSELWRYYKNPYEHIVKNEALIAILKDVEYVHIYGFSFSPVDEDYIDWIYRYTPGNARWEISWFLDTDKQRIDKFVLEHRDVKERLALINLENIKISSER